MGLLEEHLSEINLGGKVSMKRSRRRSRGIKLHFLIYVLIIQSKVLLFCFLPEAKKVSFSRQEGDHGEEDGGNKIAQHFSLPQYLVNQ